MKRPSSKVITISLCFVIALLALGNVLSLTATQTKTQTDKLGALTGTITVSIDGKIVSKQDTITSLAFSSIYCQLFYYYSDCLAANDGSMSLVTTTGTVVLPQTLYTLTGIALSSSAQTSYACTGILSGNGLSAAISTVEPSLVLPYNSPIATLLASWTFTGTSQSVLSVCLMPVQTYGSVQQVITGGNPFAFENIGSNVLTVGQTMSVSWAFNM